uniref:Uncharacterized protein n=1 Tax=Trichuris muris TaxID=70415 RepID=A0A5S6QRP0_TRIMR
MGDKDCRKVSAVKNGRIMQTRMQRHSLKAGTSHHETDNSKIRQRKSNAFSMSGLRQCGLTNVVTYDWTSFYCMTTVAPPMTPPQK